MTNDFVVGVIAGAVVGAVGTITGFVLACRDMWGKWGQK